MSKLPPLPRVRPVVRRALLGVALGAAGCPREVIVRVRNPEPGPMPDPIGCRGVLHDPAGEPLANRAIRVLVDGRPQLLQTNVLGQFNPSIPAGTGSVEIEVEGFERVRCDPYVELCEPLVLQPAEP